MFKNISNGDIQSEESQPLVRRPSASLAHQNDFQRTNYYDKFVRWYENSSLLRNVFLYPIFNYKSIGGKPRVKELLYKVSCFLWDAHSKENLDAMQLQPKEIKQFNQRAKKVIKDLRKFKRDFLRAYQAIAPDERIDWGLWERLNRYLDKATFPLSDTFSMQEQFLNLRGILQGSRLFSVDEKESFIAAVIMLKDRKVITAKRSRKLTQQVCRFCSDRKAGLLYGFIAHYGEYLTKQRACHLSLHSTIWPLNEHEAINSAIKKDSCIRGIKTFSEGLLPAAFYAILLRDIASYYLSPNDRYAGTLAEIFLGIAPNQDVWTTSFEGNNWDMALILFLSLAMTVIQYWRHYNWHEQMHIAGNLVRLLNRMHNYQSEIFNDILCWLLSGGMRTILQQAEMLVMWDNCRSGFKQTRDDIESGLADKVADGSQEEDEVGRSLTLGKRPGKKIIKVGPENEKRIKKLGKANPLLLGDAIYASQIDEWELSDDEDEGVVRKVGNAQVATVFKEEVNDGASASNVEDVSRAVIITDLFVKLIDFAESAHGFTRLAAISILGDFIARVDERDFTILAQYGVDSSIMKSRREQALNTLKEIAEHSLFANYKLWKSGNSQQRKLEPIFWGYEFLLLYAKLRVVEAFVMWIKDKVDWFIAQRDCHQQNKVFAYMPYSAMWECSVCGDKDVYYKHAFLAQTCVDSELKNSKKVDEIIEILNRAVDQGGIKSVDMRRQSWRTWTNKEFSEVLQGIYRASFKKLKFFGLAAPEKPQTAIDPKKIKILCKFMQQAEIQRIDLSGQNLTFNFTASLVEAISGKKLEDLNLSGNQIDSYAASMIAELLLRTPHLNGLNLSDTGFDDAAMEILVPILRNSTVATLDFSSNQISQNGLNAFRNISSAYLRKINLDHHDFGGLNLVPLGEAIANNEIDSISISSTKMGDMGFVTLVPYFKGANVKEAQFADNLLSFPSLRLFAQILPQSNITRLNLSGNTLGEESLAVLGHALNNSQVNQLDISRCDISDEGIQSFADTFPYQLIALDLSNNDISDVGVLSIGAALKNSTVMTLNISYNGLGDDGVLALSTALPSTLRELKLSHNGLTKNAAGNIVRAMQQTPELKVLDLSCNILHDRGMFLIVKALAQRKIVSLDISSTGIGDVIAREFAAMLPQTKMEQIFFNHNNVSNEGLVHISQSLITATPHRESIGDAYLKVDEKHAISLAQPVSSLRELSFVDNAIEAQGARALCRILPAANLDVSNVHFAGNPINEQQVDIDNCMVSAASRLEPPLGIRQVVGFFNFISQELTSGTSQAFHGLCNLVNHVADGLLKSVVEYAAEVVTDCPNYFPKDCPTYWSGNTTGLLFGNAHNVTNNSVAIGCTNLLGIGH